MKVLEGITCVDIDGDAVKCVEFVLLQRRRTRRWGLNSAEYYSLL
jgi:hypothetical protein